MKITHLRVFVANPCRKVSWGTGWGKNTIVVKIYTDEGIDGLGEAFHSLDEPIEGALLKFERWLKGKNPTRFVAQHSAGYPAGKRAGNVQDHLGQLPAQGDGIR